MKRNKRSTAHPARAASVLEERAGSTVLRSKTILIAPLNWGLGHATRCMPIIDELQRQGARVIIASDGRALRLLEKEYPDLLTIELPPYKIRYGTGSMVWNMAWQMPKILRARKYRFYWAWGHLLSGIITDLFDGITNVGFLT